MTRPEVPRPDVIVVGAGSAGCVVAERLSRETNRSVLLIEGGGGWPTDAVIDRFRLPIASGSTVARGYDEASGLPVVRGATVGGSSAVNGAYFLRRHRDDFAGWPPGWEPAVIEAAYAELDGPGGTMSVSAFGDDEMGEIALTVEDFYGATLPVRDLDEPWPIVGVNRVRSNRSGSRRRTAAAAYLKPALGRPNLRVVEGGSVDDLVTAAGSVTGVRVAGEVIGAGEVVLCAGTLGTAELLMRAGLAGVGESVSVVEHREVAVRYRAIASDARRAPVLPTVVHTEDGCEIRCYGGDFAEYIDGVAASSTIIGIAGMTPETMGRVELRDGHAVVDLGRVEGDERRRLDAHAADVVDMLRSESFAGLVDPASVTVDEVVGTSQHAHGSLSLGERVGAYGAVAGVRGLRVVDGSILPPGGRSGPHATIMMMACVIGDALASARDLGR